MNANRSESKDNKPVYDNNSGNNTSKPFETYEDISDNSSINNDKYKNGRWQPEEHVRFIKGCLLYGNNWRKVTQ
jgi:hypothetical protein